MGRTHSTPIAGRHKHHRRVTAMRIRWAVARVRRMSLGIRPRSAPRISNALPATTWNSFLVIRRSSTIPASTSLYSIRDFPRMRQLFPLNQRPVLGLPSIRGASMKNFHLRQAQVAPEKRLRQFPSTCRVLVCPLEPRQSESESAEMWRRETVNSI